jgi:hypothetical protein
VRSLFSLSLCLSLSLSLSLLSLSSLPLSSLSLTRALPLPLSHSLNKEKKSSKQNSSPCTAAPLLPSKEVTVAARTPGLGGDEKTTVSNVAEGAEMLRTVPLLRTTELPAAIGSKPLPVTSSVAAFVPIFVETRATEGAATMEAT